MVCVGERGVESPCLAKGDMVGNGSLIVFYCFLSFVSGKCMEMVPCSELLDWTSTV